MDTQTSILARSISKSYQLYQSPIGRLKEALHPFRKKYHSTFTALEDVSFDMRKGETIGIIGRNGAGKSTLLKILSGVLQPTSGEYFIKGRIASLLELGTGFNPELTGRANIFFNGMIVGLTRENLQQKLEDIIAFADIGEFIDRPVKLYSSGMLARLAFAVASHIEPEILIIDEALAVGDMAFQKKCFRRFREIRDSGATILFVSHDPYQIKGYCHRALYLKNGRCIAFGQSAEVVDAYIHDQEMQLAKSSGANETAKNTAPPPTPVATQESKSFQLT
jgi:ABC-type polysaccharide/polyol phosphate transport system ATPase subunit